MTENPYESPREQVAQPQRWPMTLCIWLATLVALTSSLVGILHKDVPQLQCVSPALGGTAMGFAFAALLILGIHARWSDDESKPLL